MANALEPQSITIELGRDVLHGDLALMDGAAGLVIFAHGSGSSRLSGRNRFVAGALNDARMATLLFDLLTDAEERVDQFTREFRFDIPRLAKRLIAVIDWAKGQPEMSHLPVGLFGASTGAAAALIAAAQRPQAVRAVVSRGGRPDLAGESLPRVNAPTLLIVGGDDAGVIDLNQDAAAQLQCEKSVAIVPGATHLFEEPGKLEAAADLARDWFQHHLRS